MTYTYKHKQSVGRFLLFQRTSDASFDLFYCPKDNGWACVDFGCTHPIDGLFWSLPNLLVGFLLKIGMLCNWFNHASYHFILFGLSLAFFVLRSFISLWNVKKNHMTNFLNEICLMNIQIISFNSFNLIKMIFKNNNLKHYARND
jgi:hypothetical protein